MPHKTRHHASMQPSSSLADCRCRPCVHVCVDGWCSIAGYVCYAIAALWLCFLLFMRKRISLAIGVIKEASRAVGYMKVVVSRLTTDCPASTTASTPECRWLARLALA